MAEEFLMRPRKPSMKNAGCFHEKEERRQKCLCKPENDFVNRHATKKECSMGYPDLHGKKSEDFQK